MKKRTAFTLVELLMASLISVLVVTGIVTLLIGGIRGVDRVATQIDCDKDASMAVELMNAMVEEAKEVRVDSPSAVTVMYPVRNADGSYNRNVLDTENTLRYFLGSVEEGPNSKSKALIQEDPDGARRVICDHVKGVDFESKTASSLVVSVATELQGANSKGLSNFAKRTIFLRNN